MMNYELSITEPQKTRRWLGGCPMSGGEEKQGWVPLWMAKLGVKPGNVVCLTKTQLRILQRPDKPLNVQVWATGMLHSPGYQGEIATTMRSGKRMNLTAGNIAAELHKIAVDYYKAAGVEATEEQWAALKETKEHIRRALEDLEEDGAAERRDAQGTPLRDLTEAQRRRLPSGQTQMFFWLDPRPAEPDKVKRQWRASHPDPADPPEAPPEAPYVEGLGSHFMATYEPPIRQILKAFGVLTMPEKAQIANSAYQETVRRAYAAARKSFLEVATTWLPQVATPVPPEVATPRSALIRKERIDEIKDEKSVSQSPAPVEERQTDRLKEIGALLIRKLQVKLHGEIPTPKLCKRIEGKLKGAPLSLLEARIDLRINKITSMGMVENLAEDVGTEWNRAAVAREKEQAEAAAANFAEWVRMAADENETPEAREYARAQLNGRTKTAG
ncbi:hypothetical protein EPO44_11060, partial [bacterium]